MNTKVLCVDDDPKVLRGYKRHLDTQFDVSTAESGKEGLEVLNLNGPFAVVVADMRMPSMDGIEFLRQVRKFAPDTVPMMLTGNSDLQTAVSAVNKGNIFRFLTKPCSPELLEEMLHAGIEQYRLITSEKELLRDTLTGTVKMLTDIVSLLNPTAFGRATRAGHYVRHIVTQLELPDAWEFELAGMLSQIGCVAIPPRTLRKLYSKDALGPDEQKLLASHPIAARKLLENIPRFGSVAQMVGRQQEPYWQQAQVDNLRTANRTDVGVQVLKVALDLEELVNGGLSFEDAWRKMLARGNVYNTEVLDALMDLHPDRVVEEIRSVKVSDLCVGMVAHENICTSSGARLVFGGQEITYPVLLLLRGAANKGGVVEPFDVKVCDWMVSKPGNEVYDRIIEAESTPEMTEQKEQESSEEGASEEEAEVSSLGSSHDDDSPASEEGEKVEASTEED